MDFPRGMDFPWWRISCKCVCVCAPRATQLTRCDTTNRFPNSNNAVSFTPWLGFECEQQFMQYLISPFPWNEEIGCVSAPAYRESLCRCIQITLSFSFSFKIHEFGALVRRESLPVLVMTKKTSTDRNEYAWIKLIIQSVYSGLVFIYRAPNLRIETLRNDIFRTCK